MSITVPLEGFGGVASLNFDVKAYATEALLLAATPKENTISVITTIPITGWYFQATEPVNMQEGEVWVAVGTSSSVAFNALKKNTLQVCPLYAKQYVGGAWVAKTAKSYQNGRWNEWIYEIDIFNNGVFLDGGGYGYTGDDSEDRVELVDGCLHLYDQSTGYCFCYTTKTYDFTGKNKLCFYCPKASTSNAESNTFTFGASETQAEKEFVASVAVGSYNDTSGKTFVVDVSGLNGSYYIKFGTTRTTYNSDNIYVQRIYFA